jgi:hypothetical protein
VSEQLLLINPRRRRAKKSHRRRAKNSRRSTRRAAGGFRIRRRRHKNPRRARARHRRHRNPIMRRRHRRHRNPMSFSGIKGVLIPAAIGAAGGMALDVAYNYLSPYIPATFTSSPYLIAAVKIAAAFGLGMLAKRFLGADKGNAFMAGAVTIQLYSAASFALSGTIPGLSGLGAYMPGSMAGLGSPNPAPYLNGGVGRLRRTGVVGRSSLSAYMPGSMAGLGALGGGQLGGFGMMPGGMNTDMD